MTAPPVPAAVAPGKPESHFAIASPFSGAVTQCRQSAQAWLISRSLAEALSNSRQLGHQVFLHFCEAAAFVAWGFMQDLQEGCLLRVAWQQTATLQISMSHAQNLMQQPALSDKAGQILLRLFSQAADCQNISLAPEAARSAEAATAALLPSTNEESPFMASSLDWNSPSQLLQGKDVAAKGEESQDTQYQVARESSIPVSHDDASDQVRPSLLTTLSLLLTQRPMYDQQAFDGLAK